MDNPGINEFSAPSSFNDQFFNIPITDIDIGRESIPILDLSTSFGRESLGILQKGSDINNVLPAEQYFNFSSLSESNSNVFDKAFLISSRKASDFKSTSTAYSTFSLDLREYDQPSIPNSLSTFHSGYSRESINELNKAFVNNAQPGSPVSIFRSRFYSVPVYSKITKEFDSENLIKQLMNRVSEGCQKLNSSISKKAKDDEEEEAGFNDSVFIEARHLTGKFSEGSNDGFILDDTDPPELLNGELEESKCDQKCDSKEIFKKIDTFLPASGYQKLNEKLDNRTMLNQMSQVNTESEKSENVTKEENKTVNNIEKSKEILNALSKILLKDDRSDKETEQGQNLLHTLGDLLKKKPARRSKSFTSVSTNDDNDSKDNSLQTRRTSSSFTNASNSKSQHVNGLGRSLSSVRGSESSLEGRNFSADNLKPKKSGPLRRGPMKATIPMENFTKSQFKETPPKIHKKLGKSFGISTPIREVHPKPMAQSTPDNRIPNVSHGSSNLKEKSNNSGSINSISSYKDSSMSKDGSYLQHSRLPRRNSMNEGRRSSISSDVKRSNSLKDTSLMKAMSKIRQNISNSMDIQKKEALRDRSNTSGRDISSLSKNDSSGSRKITDTPKRIIQVSGKENAAAIC